MIAPACRHGKKKRHGRDRNGNQRFRCVLCGKTWIEQHPRPLGDMRIPMDKVVMALKMLLDGSSIRAIERDTKLVLAWHVGRREPEDTAWFTDKLRRATTGRFQVSTDGFKPYCTAIPESFHGKIDFAQLLKVYGSRPSRKREARYSPAEIKGIRKREMWGRPDMKKVCTSHGERQNLNVRMGVRRMTRLTNAFSKKWENHEYHLAFYLLWYNYCRVHMTLKTTPAVKAKLSDHPWTLEELLITLATRS